MKRSDLLKQQLTELQILALLQRGLRASLRSFWLGIVGSLLGWGAAKILPVLLGTGAGLEWLARPVVWLLIGLAFALIPAGAFLASLSPRARWAWTLDRRLELQEQVSTAWEVVQQGQAGRLDEALLRDVLALLPRVRQRMLRRGWFLERDLVSALAALLLGAVVFTAELLPGYSSSLDAITPNPAAPSFSFPGLESNEQLPETSSPSAEPPASLGESQGAGETGQGAAPEDSPTGGEQGEGPAAGQGAPSPGLDPAGTAEALRELGSALSRQAGTYDLGQALEQMDPGRAADALQDLSDALEDLSPESRENMAEAMQEAAGAMEEAGAAGLAEDLRRAAEALQGEGEDPGEALDQLAGDLDQLAGQVQGSEMAGAQPGSGSEPASGSPAPDAEPLNRLQGEGEDLELPLDETDPAQSGLLNPAPGGPAGERVAGGALDSASQAGEQGNLTPLFPGSFLWKWRDVVWGYFQR